MMETVNAKVTVTTFREGDKADTGYRKLFKELGFAEAELLIVCCFPTAGIICLSFCFLLRRV